MFSCWGIAGSAGMAAQVRALAKALGVVPEMKNTSLKPMLAWIPNVCYDVLPHSFIVPFALSGDVVTPPWPDLVISCGRRSAIVALGLKARAGNKTRFIHIQDPQMSSRHFDLVVAMEHDTITGPNVIKARFALHAITPELLQEATLLYAPLFASYPQPRVAVLLGGTTNKYTLTQARMTEVVHTLEKLLGKTPCSLLITPSRRTGEANLELLGNAFSGQERVYLYDMVQDNPYLGLLALADYIVVSNDSVNMMSEAVATGKPVYIMRLPGHVDTKPARFAEGLIRDGFARALEDRLESWSYPASDEMAHLAAVIKKQLR